MNSSRINFALPSLSIQHFNISAWPNRRLDILKDSANYTCSSSNNSVGLGVRSVTSFGVECKLLRAAAVATAQTHKENFSTLFAAAVPVFFSPPPSLSSSSPHSYFAAAIFLLLFVILARSWQGIKKFPLNSIKFEF